MPVRISSAFPDLQGHPPLLTTPKGKGNGKGKGKHNRRGSVDRFFEVGDIVKVVSVSARTKVFQLGDIGEIVPPGRNNGMYIVEVQRKRGKIAPKHLELVEKACSEEDVRENAKLKEEPLGSQASKKFMIFVGNPGVGKSTIMAGFFKSRKIKYGPTLGKSHKTLHVTKVHHPDLADFVGLDVPGIDDESEDLRLLHDKLLQEELRHGGTYQIIFITKLENGRITRNEQETIKRILESLPPQKDGGVGIGEDQFGIIVNNIDDDTWSMMENEPGGLAASKESIKQKILAGLPQYTKYVYFQRHCDSMSYGKNKDNGKLPVLQHELATFLTELKINTKLPDTLEIKDMEHVRRQQFIAKIHHELQQGHQQVVQNALDKRKKEHQEFDKQLQAKMDWRDPKVKRYTLVLAVLSVFPIVGFALYCHAARTDLQNCLAPVLALVIPSTLLYFGQLPRVVRMIPMTVWENDDLRYRNVNLTLDFYQIFELCKECQKDNGPSILSYPVLCVYVLSLVLEIGFCNIGFHAWHSDLLDKVQQFLSIIVAFDAKTPSTIFAMFIKLALEIRPGILLDNVDRAFGSVIPFVWKEEEGEEEEDGELLNDEEVDKKSKSLETTTKKES